MRSKIIQPGNWYTHPGFKDVIIRCSFRMEDLVKIEYWNVSSGKRKFLIGEEYVFDGAFETFGVSSSWKKINQKAASLPTGLYNGN